MALVAFGAAIYAVYNHPLEGLICMLEAFIGATSIVAFQFLCMFRQIYSETPSLGGPKAMRVDFIVPITKLPEEPFLTIASCTISDAILGLGSQVLQHN